jgi:hypothetical protein
LLTLLILVLIVLVLDPLSGRFAKLALRFHLSRGVFEFAVFDGEPRHLRRGRRGGVALGLATQDLCSVFAAPPVRELDGLFLREPVIAMATARDLDAQAGFGFFLIGELNARRSAGPLSRLVGSYFKSTAATSSGSIVLGSTAQRTRKRRLSPPKYSGSAMSAERPWHSISGWPMISLIRTPSGTVMRIVTLRATSVRAAPSSSAKIPGSFSASRT